VVTMARMQFAFASPREAIAPLGDAINMERVLRQSVTSAVPSCQERPDALTNG